MIDRPADQIGEFARAGADCISIHLEADRHAHRTLSAIREAGCLAGLALNPGTSAEAVAELEHAADHILCMTVNPGWGGQAFIPGSPEKVERMRELAPDDGRSRSTAGSTPAPSARSRARGRACSSPARRSSGRDDPAAGLHGHRRGDRRRLSYH